VRGHDCNIYYSNSYGNMSGLRKALCLGRDNHNPLHSETIDKLIRQGAYRDTGGYKGLIFPVKGRGSLDRAES
jgi:hypothetical protein